MNFKQLKEATAQPVELDEKTESAIVIATKSQDGKVKINTAIQGNPAHLAAAINHLLKDNPDLMKCVEAIAMRDIQEKIEQAEKINRQKREN